MRIALTTAILLAAAMVCAEEPSSADAKAVPAPEATQADPNEQAAEPAEQKAATDQESAATEATADATEPAADAAKAEEEKPFKVPPGYRAKRINGKQMYCISSGGVTGARLSSKEQCRTEDQLRAIEKRKAEQR
jgi:hypothetical protein